MRRVILIIFCLYSLFFVVCSIASPVFAKLGLYKASADFFFLFSGTCHQQPHLSFWLLGYPMPLCCRCLGVYTGSSISAALFASNKIKIGLAAFSTLLLIALADLCFNYLLNINTGKFLRFVSGLIIGLLIAAALDYLLKKIKRRNLND